MMLRRSTQNQVDAITTRKWCDMQAPELIQRAEVAAQGTSALARVLGVPQQHVTDWKANRRTCPPDMRARMAAMCGLDPVAEAMEALAEGLSETRRSGLMEAIEASEAAGSNCYGHAQRRARSTSHTAKSSGVASRSALLISGRLVPMLARPTSPMTCVGSPRTIGTSGIWCGSHPTM